MNYILVILAVAMTSLMASGYVLFFFMTLISVILMPFVAFFAYAEHLRMKHELEINHQLDDRIQSEVVDYQDLPIFSTLELINDSKGFEHYNRLPETLEDVG